MQKTNSLQSELLTLVASTATHVRTELEAPEQLAHLLGAIVSPEWPSGEYDRDAMEFFLSRFEEGGESAEGWYGWYALSPDGGSVPRTLLGAGGYFGPPDADGTVEVGYSILPEWQRRGYASEIVKLLAAHAFTFSKINRIVAHTAEDNPASIKVLVRSGFHPAGAGAEAGTLRFERARAEGARVNPLMILIAGPYRSGTNDDPALIAKNVEAMTQTALAVFRRGHLPMLGEWPALPLIEAAGSRHIGDAAFDEIFHPVSRRLVARCDGCLRIGGASAGADEMVSIAMQHGKTVYTSIDEIPASV